MGAKPMVGPARAGGVPRMEALAVVLNGPGDLAFRRLPLRPPTDADVVVDVAWSGISTGTERLLWQGRMPHFPGMGYPLVPGYEAVGRIVAGAARQRASDRRCGVRAGRQLLSATCAACSAAPRRGSWPRPRAWSRSIPAGRARGAAGAGRDRVSRDCRARRDRGQISSSGTACWAGCWPASHRCRAAPRRWCGRLIPTAYRGRQGYQVIDPRAGRAARLPLHLRRQRRPDDPRQPDRAPCARAARSCWPASMPIGCRSPSRPPSCARRGCASRREWPSCRSRRGQPHGRAGTPVARRTDYPSHAGAAAPNPPTAPLSTIPPASR